MAQVLMVIHGTDGDVLPFVKVGRALLRRDHDVTVFTHSYYAPAVHSAGLDFVAIDTIAEYEHYLVDAAGQFDATDLDDFRRHVERTGLLDQLRFECGQLVRRNRPGDTILVGAPLSVQSVLTAAEAMNAPAVCLTPSPFQLTARASVGRIYARLLAGDIDAARARLGLNPVKDWPAWMTSADAYIGLWPQWFDDAGTPAPPGTHLVGFVLGDDGAETAGVHTTTAKTANDANTMIADAVATDTMATKALPAAAAALLDGPPQPVLVTGGTGRLLQRDFYRAALAGLQSVGRPVLLVVRHRDLVPDQLAAHVHWFSRLPFRTVVPRAAVVVHHGGIGTLSRAVAAGTPQVILASGLDRPDNATRAARRLNIGWLPQDRWSPEEIADRVLTALTCPPSPPPTDSDMMAADRAAVIIENVLANRRSHVD